MAAAAAATAAAAAVAAAGLAASGGATLADTAYQRTVRRVLNTTNTLRELGVDGDLQVGDTPRTCLWRHAWGTAGVTRLTRATTQGHNLSRVPGGAGEQGNSDMWV